MSTPIQSASDPIFDFDKTIDNRGTNSIKWEFRVHDGQATHWNRTDPELGEEQILPMWVADMDFEAAPAIRDALTRRAAHGVYGYARDTQSYRDSIVSWMDRRQGWKVASEWIVPTPGVVPALHLIMRRYTQPGDKALIQRPVYHPFSFAVENTGRQLINSPLQLRDGRYEMDFDDLEAKLADPILKIATICSPHNPVGRVWTVEELRRFAQLCQHHNVLVVADEIHSDLVLPGHRFVPYGSIGDEFLDNAIICTAPSKAFNLAGLKTSNLIIPNIQLRQQMEWELRANGIYGMSLFGIAATEAAYNDSADWLDAAVAYIDANFKHLDGFLTEHLPSLELIRPEGTYLAWIDCRGLGLSQSKLNSLMFDAARIYLDEGDIFGAEGEGFVRINVACPRARLEQALERIRRAIAGLNER